MIRKELPPSHQTMRRDLTRKYLGKEKGDDLQRLIHLRKRGFELFCEQLGKSRIVMVDNCFLNLKSYLTHSYT